MTENEYTIDELIDFMYNVMDDSDEEAIPLVKEVIQALEKIQRYRAIGTVEELQELKCVITDFPLDCGDTVTTVKEILHQLSKYLKIGTVEEFKALKEKNMAKKPIFKFEYEDGRQFYDCPVCGAYVMHAGVQSKEKYCSNCGTKLAWSE